MLRHLLLEADGELIVGRLVIALLYCIAERGQRLVGQVHQFINLPRAGAVCDQKCSSGYRLPRATPKCHIRRHITA